MLQAHIIAIIDDDPDMLQSIGRILELRGFTTLRFASAEQFLLNGAAYEAHCLVVDINLAGMSGVELYRQLQKAGKHIPAIFINALEEQALRDQLLEKETARFLQKPFTANALLKAISQTIIAPA
jgi:FixJ family two-component response regulator